MKKWILGHRKIVTTSIICFAIVMIFGLTNLTFCFSNGESEYIEILYFVSQIVSVIFVISGVVIAIWQYYLSCVESKRNLDVICVQKAIDLSEYYKDNILSYIAPIRYILRKSGISDVISKIDKSHMLHFDEKELYSCLKQEDITKLKDIQKSERFFEIVIEANSIYNLGLNQKLISYYEDEEKIKQLSAEQQDILATFLGKLITKVLNNMEFFALHFTHKVADESVVYTSLHQTYIDIVQMLYYNIASKNPLSTVKFFTNVIELYEIWNSKAMDEEKNYVEGVRALANKGTVVESDKIL